MHSNITAANVKVQGSLKEKQKARFWVKKNMQSDFSLPTRFLVC